MAELPEHRLKRLYMRSIRRGIKEMDLILQSYATANLSQMAPEQLDHYEAMLEENDHDLYLWVTGQQPAPTPYGPLIADITAQLSKNLA